MKFRVRKGFEGGWTAGDVKGRSGDVVETTPERGAQLAAWLEPLEAMPTRPKTVEAAKPDEDAPRAADVPGAPPLVNNVISHAPHAGGRGRKGRG